MASSPAQVAGIAVEHLDTPNSSIRYPSHHCQDSRSSGSTTNSLPSSSPSSQKQPVSQYQSNGSTNHVHLSQLSETDMYNIAKVMKKTGLDRPQAVKIYLISRECCKVGVRTSDETFF
jgi:hypothetical protein